MLLNSIKLMIGIIAAVVFCGNVSAQGFGSGYAMTAFGGGLGGYSNYGALGGAGIIGDNCGRGITQGQAESLWAGYCTESCAYPGSYGGDVSAGGGGGCRLFGGGGGCKLFGGGLKSGGGLFSGGGGGDCFGYPSDGCCDSGCGGGGFGGGGIISGFGGGFGGGMLGSSTCDSGAGGGCRLFGGGGGCRARGRGTGLFSKFMNMGGGGGGCCFRRNRGGSTGYAVDYVPVAFQSSASQCGSNDAYFNEFVGHEYGTSGMQSVVSGCATGACGGGYNAPAASMSYGGGQAQDMSYGTGAVDMGHSQGMNYGGGAIDYGQQAIGAGGMGGQPMPEQAKSIIGQAVSDAIGGHGN